jgi:hypothetical protein
MDPPLKKNWSNRTSDIINVNFYHSLHILDFLKSSVSSDEVEPKEKSRFQPLWLMRSFLIANVVVDYFWGDTSKEEKRLIRKLGMLLQPFNWNDTKTHQISLFL